MMMNATVVMTTMIRNAIVVLTTTMMNSIVVMTTTIMMTASGGDYNYCSCGQRQTMKVELDGSSPFRGFLSPPPPYLNNYLFDFLVIDPKK